MFTVPPSSAMDTEVPGWEIRTHYPRLCKGVTLHVTPTFGIVKYGAWSSAFKGDIYSPLRGMDIINDAASRLLSLCDGSLSIADAVKRIYPEAKVQEVIKPVVDFFLNAQRKGHLEILEKQSKTSEMVITGSFDFYVPFHISVELTSRCNLHCSYCYNQFLVNEHELTAHEFIEILAEWKRLGLMGVELTGGEPLLKRGFWDILQFCGQHLEIIGLLTNGTVVDERSAEILSTYREKMVVGVSLDGSSPEIHDKLRGKGSFYQTLNGIKNLVASRLMVRVGMTVTPSNIYDLENTIKLAKSLGAKFFSWSPVVAFGRGTTHAWSWNSSEAMAIHNLEKRMIEEYRDFFTVVSKETEVYFQKLGNCGLGYKNIAVSPSGKVRPCLFLSEAESIGDLRKDSLRNVLSHPLMQFFRNLKMPAEDDCMGCKYQLVCAGCIVKPLTVIEKEGKLCVWAKTNKIGEWLGRYQKYQFDPEQPIFSIDGSRHSS